MPGVSSSGGWELVVFFRARLPVGFAEASRGWAAGVGQRARDGLGVEWPFWRDLAGCVWGVSQFGWSPLGLGLGGGGRLGSTEQVFQRSWKPSLITGIKDLDISGVARIWDLTFHFKFLLRRNFKGK